MESFERTERLLALILLQNMKESRTEEKVKSLNLVGFTNVEIAELLKINPQVVANYLFKAKKTIK